MELRHGPTTHYPDASPRDAERRRRRARLHAATGRGARGRAAPRTTGPGGQPDVAPTPFRRPDRRQPRRQRPNPSPGEGAPPRRPGPRPAPDSPPSRPARGPRPRSGSPLPWGGIRSSLRARPQVASRPRGRHGTWPGGKGGATVRGRHGSREVWAATDRQGTRGACNVGPPADTKQTSVAKSKRERGKEETPPVARSRPLHQYGKRSTAILSSSEPRPPRLPSSGPFSPRYPSLPRTTYDRSTLLPTTPEP